MHVWEEESTSPMASFCEILHSQNSEDEWKVFRSIGKDLNNICFISPSWIGIKEIPIVIKPHILGKLDPVRKCFNIASANLIAPSCKVALTLIFHANNRAAICTRSQISLNIVDLTHVSPIRASYHETFVEKTMLNSAWIQDQRFLTFFYYFLRQ